MLRAVPPALLLAQMQIEYEPGANGRVALKPWLLPAAGYCTSGSEFEVFAVMAVQLLPTWIAVLTDTDGWSGQSAQPEMFTTPTPPVTESMLDPVGGTAVSTRVPVTPGPGDQPTPAESE